MTRFTVVTPSYNQAPFIAETIESVLTQAGDFELEYIVMDGGSTDGSIDIIRHYAELVASGAWPLQCVGLSMTWVSRRDNGQSDAINQGLRTASGDIMSYINSDDLYVPGALQRVTCEFTRRPDADFVYGDGDVIDETGRLQWEWLSRPYDHRLMTSYYFLWNNFTNYIMQQATFWRRRVMERIGYFDETFHYAMDAEYWIRAGHNGLRLHHSPHKLAKFRMIQGTKSLSSPTVFWGDYLEIYRRYRGVHALRPFLAYFFYNLARQYDFDLDTAWDQGQNTLLRWEPLPPGERCQLEWQKHRGFDLACLLVALELRSHRRNGQATNAFRRGLAGTPIFILHPVALAYLLQACLGIRLWDCLARWSKYLIRWYRWHRYEYRYHPRWR